MDQRSTSNIRRPLFDFEAPCDRDLFQNFLEAHGSLFFPPCCALATKIYDISKNSCNKDFVESNGSLMRQQEFAAGRACAQIGLQNLGHPYAHIPVGSFREPIWPRSIVGSISHTGGLAAAVVARQEEITALGLDIEIESAADRNLWDEILTDAEKRWVQLQPSKMQKGLATLIFCSKEAFYKLQYPSTKAWIDFKDAEVSFNLLTGALRLKCSTLPTRALFGRSCFSGICSSTHGFSIAAMYIEKNAPAE